MAESAKLKVADKFPDSAGANATSATQLAEAASVAPHVLEVILKSFGFVPPSAMLLMFNDVVPLFVSVAAFAAPVLPIVTETQFRAVGLTDALPEVVATAVPVNATVCGVFIAESVKLSVALRVPAAVGLKTTEAEQLAAAARLVPQVFDEMLKSPAFVPPRPTLLIVIDALVPFASVDEMAALLDPTLTLPNETEDGLAVTVPLGATAVPVNAIVCGLLLAESVKLSVAVRAPVVVGLNSTFAVQLAEAASVDPQVSLYILKSPGFAPPSATVLIVIDAGLPFVRVTTFCAPAFPTVTDTQFKVVGDTDTCACKSEPLIIRLAIPGKAPHLPACDRISHARLWVRWSNLTRIARIDCKERVAQI